MASAPGREIRTMATLPDPGATAVAMAAMVSNPRGRTPFLGEKAASPPFQRLPRQSRGEGITT
jgi:hypothetical protein